MTKEKQRIVIAEFCGAKHVQFLGKKAWTFEGYPNPENLLCPMEHGECLIDVPNYPEDLNAMHEAECHLKVGQVESFVEELMGLIPKSEYGPRDRLFWFCHATASQRSEAFVKTIGKWEEQI